MLSNSIVYYAVFVKSQRWTSDHQLKTMCQSHSCVSWFSNSSGYMGRVLLIINNSKQQDKA